MTLFVIRTRDLRQFRPDHAENAGDWRKAQAAPLPQRLPARALHRSLELGTMAERREPAAVNSSLKYRRRACARKPRLIQVQRCDRVHNALT